MGCPKISAMLIVMAVVVLVVATTTGVEGQTNVPPCEQVLAPCENYFNSTNPPASCCNALGDAITNDLSCLCNLYILYNTTPALVATLNFNFTQVHLFPQRSNIPLDLNSCVEAPAPSPTSSTDPAPATNGVGRITRTGMFTILFFWTCMMIYRAGV